MGLTQTDLDELPGWAHVVAIPESDIDDLAAEIQGIEGKTARVLRGQRCQTRERLFQELAAALQFPHYFGENWDAVEECLGDLGWIDDPRLTLLVTNSDQLLPHHEAEFVAFVNVLRSVHELEDGPLERMVFHCAEGKRAAMEKRLKGLNGGQGTVDSGR